MHIRLPNDLAVELVERGLAKKGMALRGTSWQLVLDALDTAGTLVTLLGTPIIYDHYSTWIKNVLGRRKGKSTIIIIDPNGQRREWVVPPEVPTADIRDWLTEVLPTEEPFEL